MNAFCLVVGARGLTLIGMYVAICPRRLWS